MTKVGRIADWMNVNCCTLNPNPEPTPTTPTPQPEPTSEPNPTSTPNCKDYRDNCSFYQNSCNTTSDFMTGKKKVRMDLKEFY